jgi:hypothetical protein
MSRGKKIRSAWDDEVIEEELAEGVDESIYSEESREELVENDELTPLEEAFMMGWEDADKEDEMEVEE